MKRKNRQGFTLIEVIIAAVLFALILESVYTTLLVGQNSWINYSNNVLSRQDVRRALLSMTKELREAKNIFIIKEEGGGVTLNFDRPSVGSVSYKWRNKGENTNKIIRENYTNHRVLASNISFVSFDYPTDNEIIITVSGGKDKTFNLKEKVTLRLKTNLFLHNL